MRFYRSYTIFPALLVAFILLPIFFSVALGQQASVKESNEKIKTYPFSDPNPVPVLGINKKVAPFYPYHMFDGYTDKGGLKEWKIIMLENQFISVSVLPEVGGKVMGAIEKATRNEFVYLNHVMKFRAIGIRGPWTSGGIEHNFGLDLGHAPWAAAPVDYIIKNNEDGSVSCIVGGLDLASRSEWRVEIRLPKDKAYFETNSLWYNPGPLHHSYLSWENAAFKASDDLQFYFPGNFHIGHDGSASRWPIDKEGRNLALYKNNNFGDSKSYHVVGNYRNWFGGYWHDKKFGFGHWAPYTDAPGKKLWIWALSREGAIWENLLTDHDGQYIEAQSGAILNQAAERSGYHSPFTQLSLRPLYAETKKEFWFPVKNIGGMADASPFGTLNVIAIGDSLKIAVSPNTFINDSLTVTHKRGAVFSAYLQLQPMKVFEKIISLPGFDLKDIRVSFGNDKLLFAEKENQINRPFVASATDTAYRSAQRFFRMAEEQNSMRNFNVAFDYYQRCLSMEPGHYEALSRIAEHYYRTGEYKEGIKYALKVLEFDTYNGTANFIYGNLLQKQGKLSEAEEALSIAARTMEFRSASYVNIAGIQLQKNNFEQAAYYARRSLEYNRNNLLAYQFLTTAYRKQKEIKQADSILALLSDVDPLNHYARFEKYLLKSSTASLNEFNSFIRNEFPHETYLELAITYANNGLNDEAIKVLEQAPAYPTVYYWLAWLKRNIAPGESLSYLDKAESMSPAFVFPFRLESVAVLDWASKQRPSWKTIYYLALVHWNNLNPGKAKELFLACGDKPDFAPFYLSRAAIFQGDSSKIVATGADLDLALQLEPGGWRNWHHRTEYLFEQGLFEQAYKHSASAYKQFKNNPIVSMDYAKALLNTNRLKECIAVLNNTLVLPQEGAQEGHEIYEMANLLVALESAAQKKYQQAIRYLDDAKKWPENLGSGSPYNPDTRLHDFIAAYCENKLGNPGEARKYYKNIADFSLDVENWKGGRNPIGNYISVLVLNQEGRQSELKELMSEWKNEQDSLRNWSLTQGAVGKRFDWVLAKYNNENEKAERLGKELVSPAIVSRFNILLKALEIIRSQH
jgi:tetratricopeptide (TPR) repeat protein